MLGVLVRYRAHVTSVYPLLSKANRNPHCAYAREYSASYDKTALWNWMAKTAIAN
jgi:hypothetical protein